MVLSGLVSSLGPPTAKIIPSADKLTEEPENAVHASITTMSLTTNTNRLLEVILIIIVVAILAQEEIAEVGSCRPFMRKVPY